MLRPKKVKNESPTVSDREWENDGGDLRRRNIPTESFSEDFSRGDAEDDTYHNRNANKEESYKDYIKSLDETGRKKVKFSENKVYPEISQHTHQETSTGRKTIKNQTMQSMEEILNNMVIDNPSYGLLENSTNQPTSAIQNIHQNLCDQASDPEDHIYAEIKEQEYSAKKDDSYIMLKNPETEHIYEIPNNPSNIEDQNLIQNFEHLESGEPTLNKSTLLENEERQLSTSLQNTLRHLDKIAEKRHSNDRLPNKQQTTTNTFEKEIRDSFENFLTAIKNKIPNKQTQLPEDNIEEIPEERNKIIIELPVETKEIKCVQHKICGNTANWQCKKCFNLVCSRSCMNKIRCEPLSQEQIDAGGLVCRCGNTLHDVELIQHYNKIEEKIWLGQIGTTNVYKTTRAIQGDYTQTTKSDKKPKKINMIRVNNSDNETLTNTGGRAEGYSSFHQSRDRKDSSEEDLERLLTKHVDSLTLGKTLPINKVELGYLEELENIPQPIPREYGPKGEELNLVAYFEGKKIIWPFSTKEEEAFRQDMWKNHGPPKHQGWTWKWEHIDQEEDLDVEYIFWNEALKGNDYPNSSGNWVRRHDQYFWHSTPIQQSEEMHYGSKKKNSSRMPTSGPERYTFETPLREAPKLKERNLESFYNSLDNSKMKHNQRETSSGNKIKQEVSTRKLETTEQDKTLNMPRKANSKQKRWYKHYSSTESEGEEIEFSRNKSNYKTNILIKSEPESDSDNDEETNMPPDLTKALNRLKPFPGKLNDTKALRDFFNELQAIFSVYLPRDIQKRPQLADKIKAKALQVSLTENALGYFASLSPEIKNSYDKAKAQIKTRFTEPTTTIYILQKLAELQQGGLTVLALKERVEDLVHRYIEEDQGLKNATLQVKSEVKKFLKIHNFRQALRKEIHDEIIKGNKISEQNFDSLVERALEIEAAQRIIRARDSFGKLNRTQKLMYVEESNPIKEGVGRTPQNGPQRSYEQNPRVTFNSNPNQRQYMMQDVPRVHQTPAEYVSQNRSFPRNTSYIRNPNFIPNMAQYPRQESFRVNRPEDVVVTSRWGTNNQIPTRRQIWYPTWQETNFRAGRPNSQSPQIQPSWQGTNFIRRPNNQTPPRHPIWPGTNFRTRQPNNQAPPQLPSWRMNRPSQPRWTNEPSL